MRLPVRSARARPEWIGHADTKSRRDRNRAGKGSTSLVTMPHGSGGTFPRGLPQDVRTESPFLGTKMGGLPSSPHDGFRGTSILRTRVIHLEVKGQIMCLNLMISAFGPEA